jgi:hypothetical protein
MIKNYYGMAMIMAAFFAGSGAQASDVYVDQAGDTGTFNITQSGGSNRVGTISTPSVFEGNNITVDIIQNGTLNEADIQALTATDTVIDYNAQGSSNTLEIEIANNGNELNVAKTGDNNSVTMCGANNISTAAPGTGGASPTIAGSVAAGARTVGCTSAVDVADTETNITLTGSNNAVNLALDSANATNTISVIGGYNAVNLAQGGSGIHVVGVSIDGDTNTTNITQLGTGSHNIVFVVDVSTNLVKITEQ